MEKLLKQKFMNGDKLGLLDNLRIKLLQSVTDCDGMCNNNCNIWYCNTYRIKQQLNYLMKYGCFDEMEDYIN